MYRKDAGTLELLGKSKEELQAMLAAMDGNFAAYDWRDVSASPWAYNHMLFDAAGGYVDSLRLDDPEDLAELISLAKTSEPSDIGVHIRRKFVEVQP